MVKEYIDQCVGDILLSIKGKNDELIESEHTPSKEKVMNNVFYIFVIKF